MDLVLGLAMWAVLMTPLFEFKAVILPYIITVTHGLFSGCVVDVAVIRYQRI